MDDGGDRMFCHQCGSIWLRRSETGLVCPNCESDFTEIIEIPPDTEPEPPGLNAPPSPPRRARTHSPFDPFGGHNPWAHGEPEEDDYDDRDPFGFGGHGTPGFAHRTYRSPDGRFTFSSTTFGGGGGGGGGGRGGASRLSPGMGGGGEFGGDPLLPMVNRLNTIFGGLADTYREQAPGRRREGFHDDVPDPEERAPDEPHEFGPRSRLYPRDADRAQPMAPPIGTLGDILELFQQDFGQRGQAAAGPGGNGGFRVMTGPNPLALLSTLLNPNRQGDAVYTQEELDRVITQLFEHNANGTAPPPASQNVIQSLPKKAVDQEMLDSDGKAECSICMDAVELGTEVTVLPCKHWFHYSCIEMWLNQHNTCPHCRRGVDVQSGTRENPVSVDDTPEPASRRASGASGPSWSGSADNQDRQRPSRSNGDQGGGGFSSWVRSHFGGA